MKTHTKTGGKATLYPGQLKIAGFLGDNLYKAQLLHWALLVWLSNDVFNKYHTNTGASTRIVIN